MILVRLTGGLGNQMFQYAAARRLAEAHGTDLKIDTSRLLNSNPLDTPRDYALGCFTISAAIASANESLLCEKLHQQARSPLYRLLKKCGLLRAPGEMNYVRQQGPAFDPAILLLPDNVCLDGYWQSEKYFPGIRALLKKEFTLRRPLDGEDRQLAEKIRGCAAVSLHVRRGDYLTNPHAAKHHGTCDRDYYDQAVSFIMRKIPAAELFIFSDDPHWSAMNMNFDLPTTIVSKTDGTAEGRDLILMSSCRHHIIANSSFSWWGAWLGDDPEKIVIAPKRWFNDPARFTGDLVPEGWLRF
ncbi:MAG: alpha-1,2-fucosyltransferase [Deltaproteobacteria bacterium]|nr:alpha-1,2-fucosyltransferase [Deltaproteobacteria bacterium]TLN03134.1 MAG: alpha-1,2-fucosyltransferase [bacterium]